MYSTAQTKPEQSSTSIPIAGATIERAYRVRLRPTKAQQLTLNRLFGATRHVWNQALERRTAAYREHGERLNWVSLSTWYTEYRSAPGSDWLSTLPREPFNQVLRDQERAFSNCFAKRARYPKYRRRGTHDSVRFTLDQRREQVDRDAGTVQLDGLGRVRFKNTYGALPGRLRSVTVSRDAGGRYVAAFTADQVPAPSVPEATVSAVGIDLGLGSLAVLSDGTRVGAPKPLAKKLHRLRRYQRRASRQRDAALRRLGLDPGKPIPKGTRIPVSNRARRTRQRIGRLHTRIADQRRDALHQLTHAVTRTCQVICLEDLNLKGMQRSGGRRAFRRSVNDAALGELRRQIEYKAAWRGRVVSVVDRFFPSSKRCSVCGTTNHSLSLSERTWICECCDTPHDRDLNAANNILTEGLRLLSATPGNVGKRGSHLNARGETPVREQAHACSTRPDSVKREPVKRRTPPSVCSSRLERRRADT